MVSGTQSHSKQVQDTSGKEAFKLFNQEHFVSAVQNLSWIDLYLCADVDDAVELLSRKLTCILDEMAPMKTFQVRTCYSPWLSKETVRLMKVRDELHKLASETRDRDDWARFKHMRNRINNRLKYEESH